MSKDVKPLTPTKRTKPYTIKELAALKDAQGPRAESLLDFLGVQATVEALDEARADNAALLERLKKAEEERDEMRREHAQRQAEWKQAQGVFMTAEARVKELEEALREVAGFFENSRRAESKGAHEYNAAFMRALVMGVVDAALSTPKVKP